MIYGGQGPQRIDAEERLCDLMQLCTFFEVFKRHLRRLMNQKKNLTPTNHTRRNDKFTTHGNCVIQIVVGRCTRRLVSRYTGHAPDDRPKLKIDISRSNLAN
jgi:hypothetical protein